MTSQLTLRTRGALCGLTAAFLYGISPPFAKLLIPGLSPLLMAALLYLGAGLGLLVMDLMGGRFGWSRSESPVQRTDKVLVMGIVLLGGVLGPLLMLWGLSRLSAVPASLLLNLEAPLTMVVALAFFGEHLTWLESIGAALVVAGTLLLSGQGGDAHVDLPGFFAIIGATACWALDNNLTQRLSLRDPFVVIRIKTLGAGLLMFGLAMVMATPLPSQGRLLAVLVLGLFSYGISLVLDMYALRLIGAAREAAYFATAPFIGAAVAVPVLNERWTIGDWLAAITMGIGVAILMRARHGHLHRHEALQHEHAHRHDDEHHDHHTDEAVSDAHSHPHHHPAVAHDHPHVSEVHHRHEHGT